MTWREETIEKLKAMRARGKSYGAIATALGTSRSAVAGKCSRLDLPKVGRDDCWTADEDRILKAQWSKLSVKEIAALLPRRNASAVYHRAAQIVLPARRG